MGEPDSSGDYYFAAFDLDGNEVARSSQPVGSFDAVMMKRPNGYLLDTGYMWELYAPDGTFLEKSLPVGERETLCQLCGEFCTFDVFLPLEENAFLAVGHHAKPPSRTSRWCSASLRTSEPTALAGRLTQKQRGRGKALGPLWNNRRKRYGRNAGIQVPLLRWRHPI